MREESTKEETLNRRTNIIMVGNIFGYELKPIKNVQLKIQPFTMSFVKKTITKQ